MKTTLLGSLGILGVLVATAAPSSAFCDHKHGCCCSKPAQGAAAGQLSSTQEARAGQPAHVFVRTGHHVTAAQPSGAVTAFDRKGNVLAVTGPNGAVNLVAGQGAILVTAPRGASAGSTCTVSGGGGQSTCSSSSGSCSSSASQGACASSSGGASAGSSSGACSSSGGGGACSSSGGAHAHAAPSGASAPHALTFVRGNGAVALAPLGGDTVAVAPLGGASIARAPLAPSMPSESTVQGGVAAPVAPRSAGAPPANAPAQVRSLLSRVRGDSIAPAPAAETPAPGHTLWQRIEVEPVEAPAPCDEPAEPCTPCPQEAPSDGARARQSNSLGVHIAPDGQDYWMVELPELTEVAELAELPEMSFDLALPDFSAFEGLMAGGGDLSEEEAEELVEAQREAEEAAREAHEEAMQSWRESQEEWRANQATWQEEARERAREALERAREAQRQATEQWREQSQALRERMREHSQALQERVRAQSEALRERLGSLQERARVRTDEQRAAEPRKRTGRTFAKRTDKAPEGGGSLDERIARIEGQLTPGSAKQDARSLDERVAELEKLLQERDVARGFYLAAPRTEAKVFGNGLAPEARTRVEVHGLAARPFEARLGRGAWRLGSDGAWKRLDDGQARAWKLETDASEQAKANGDDAQVKVRAEIEERMQELRARMDELRERMQQLRSKLETGSTR